MKSILIVAGLTVLIGIPVEGGLLNAIFGFGSGWRPIRYPASLPANLDPQNIEGDCVTQLQCNFGTVCDVNPRSSERSGPYSKNPNGNQRCRPQTDKDRICHAVVFPCPDEYVCDISMDDDLGYCRCDRADGMCQAL